MMDSPTYTQADFEKITAAYRELFPGRLSQEASAYLDFGRKRQWSCLTTDFRISTWKRMKMFHDAARIARREHESRAELASRLRQIVVEHEVGFSLGFSPWTDNLLLRTFNERNPRLVIVLAHNWYPIVSPNGRYQARPPLMADATFERAPYKGTIPRPQSASVLFLNLIPDFLPPEAPVKGVQGNKSDYAAWAAGLEALMRSLRPNVEIAGMISWGSPVWEALRTRLPREWWTAGVMAALERQHAARAAHSLPLAGRMIPYFATSHPSDPRNFRRPTQVAAYGWAAAWLANSNQP